MPLLLRFAVDKIRDESNRLAIFDRYAVKCGPRWKSLINLA